MVFLLRYMAKYTGIVIHFEIYVIFDLDFGKKIRGLNIYAKTLIFCVVTLDRLS